MGAVSLAIERIINAGREILPDPPASGYYTTGDLEENPALSGLYTPAGLSESGPGLYDIPVVGYSGLTTDNLKAYSVQEDATTINAGTYSGGFGQLTIDMNDESRDLIRVINDRATLSDPVLGKVTGTVRNMSSEDGNVTITADSTLGLFNADKEVAPFTGRFEDALRYYCEIANIPIELVVQSRYDENGNLIDDIPNRQVTFPGWVGNMWDHLKEILVSQQVEMSQVFDQVIVRPLRTVIANTERNSSFGWTIDNQSTSRQVQINYYPTERQVSGEFYPVAGEEATIYQVDAGETLTFTLQLPHSLEYVNQPECVEFVQNRTYEGTNGVYSVAGNDGLPIKPAQWQAQGGLLTVRLTEDPSVVEVTLTGASGTEAAPYRIAMTSGEFYNSMHLTGTGLFQQEESVTIYTGASSAVTGDDIGVVVENRNIQTLAQALTLGAKVAGSYALSYSIRGQAFNLNRANASRDEIVATLDNLDEYNALNIPGAIERLGDFNTLWSSFPQIDDFWIDYLAKAYENQAFGNAAGARVLREDNNFRIDQATITPEGISYSGSVDTVVSDFDDAWTPEGVGVVDSINYHPLPRATSIGALWGYQLGTGETAATSLVTPSTPKRTNLARNPRGTDPARWYASFGTGGAGTETMVSGASDGPLLPDGTRPTTYARYTFTTANTGGNSLFGYNSAVPVANPYPAGSTAGLAIYVRSSRAAPSAIRLYGRGLTAANTQTDPSYSPSFSDAPAGQWVRIGMVHTVTSAVGDWLPYAHFSNVLFQVGDTVDVVCVMIEPGAVEVGPYFDGDTQNTGDATYTWTGSANASTSTATFNDGPLVPDGSRIGTYVRRTITTAKTAGNSGPWSRVPNGTYSLLPGDRVSPTMYVRFSVEVTATVQSSARSGSGILSTSTETITIPANTWTRVGQMVTATAATDNTQVWATLSPGTILPIGTTVDTTGGQSELGEVTPYFDGSTLPHGGHAFRWTGAVDNSISERVVGPTRLRDIDSTWGVNSTVNDFSLASLRRN